MRSANRGNANNVWNVNSSGNVNNNNASNAYRCAPDCVKHIGTWLSCKGGALLKKMTQGAECPAGKAKQYRGDTVSPRAGTVIHAMDFKDRMDDGRNAEENIIGFEALYESMERCKRGVLWKDSAAHYYLNALEETLRLEEQLKDGTYKARKPKQFTVTSPKKREIVSISFRDRVYQRSLNDNSIYPQMTKSFIYDNAACQKGKGTDFARGRLKCFLQKFYRKHGTDGYVLQCDIHGYYPNMRHDVALDKFRRGLDPETYRRTKDVLTQQYDGDVGFNPGSQMVQIAGIAVLDDLDHMIKEWLRIKYYIRYMDDLILICHDREYLEYCKEEIRKHLDSKGFEFNESKTRIYPISEGIMFLGFRFKLTGTGKVLMLINPKNVKAERKKLYRLAQKAKRGEITREKVDFCYASWRDHASKGNSYKLLQRMDRYYKDLWKGE